jgi:protocatechuate 3,4-dioxygenase beta subunit
MRHRQFFFSDFQQTRGALSHRCDRAGRSFGNPRTAVAAVVFLTTWLSATFGAATDRYRIEPSSSPGLIGNEVTVSPDIRATQTLPSPVSVGRTNLVSPDEPGDRLLIHGTIFAADRKTPVTNAVLRIYHTDASGLYSREVNNAEGERNARLQALLQTDGRGRYEVHTIMPGRYPGGKTPAHVHFLVSAPGYNDRNATFSFSGDPALTPEDYEKHGRDGSFSSVRPAERGADGILRCQRDVRLLKQGQR